MNNQLRGFEGLWRHNLCHGVWIPPGISPSAEVRRKEDLRAEKKSHPKFNFREAISDIVSQRSFHLLSAITFMTGFTYLDIGSSVPSAVKAPA
jgi:hypothetical protein